MKLDRRTSLMILAALPGFGPVRIRTLDQTVPGGVDQLLQMDPARRRNWCPPGMAEELGRWRQHFDPDKVQAELDRLDADFVTFEESGYPDCLQPFSDRPVGLYRQLAGKVLSGRQVAIVGTRQPSAYGRKVAREFAAGLGEKGFTIVSGLAEGIDTEAHRAALECGGRTLAVLGGGLNRCYPSSNKSLLQIIKKSGGVWTEFPLWRSADRRSFPQRNRIVAALSEAVVVVESGSAGGSLITARMASEQGRSVYVVPGRIDSPESMGCHALIRDGAQLVTSVEEILQDLDYLPAGLNPAHRPLPPPGRPRQRPEPVLGGLQARVWEFLGEQRQAHPDSLASRLEIPVARINALVLEMELAGLLCRRLDGCYERA